jgi:hypothetical protein
MRVHNYVNSAADCFTLKHTGVKNKVWIYDFCMCWHHVEVGWVTQDLESPNMVCAVVLQEPFAQTY